MQIVSRVATFDSMHRVMDERMKCFNVHGHTYKVELNFAYDEMMDIGYAIDFKEIKRVHLNWIDEKLDHAAILNPHDSKTIMLCQELSSKYYLMSLNFCGYCNPTAENIAKELYIAMQLLSKNFPSLSVHEIVLWETPNCFVKCSSVNTEEKSNFEKAWGNSINEYLNEKGVVEYDQRKL